jgi:DNA-binding XRE family transcriptional regulator
MAKSFDSLVRRTTTKRTRDRAAKRTKELLGELLVSELRQMTGKSQREIAALIGIKQPSIAKIEKQNDMQISTLEKIVKALGGELELVARFPRGTVKIRQPGSGVKRNGRSHSPTSDLQLF